MNKKMVIIMGSMGRGGAERVISLISDYFVSKGWEVWIGIVLIYKIEYEINPNIHIVDLTGTTESRIKRIPLWLSGIRKLVNDVKPDVVLSFAARINIISQIALLGKRIKLVVSERNDPRFDGRGKFADILTKILYPKADAVVFQTQRAADYFEGLKLKNSYIIPNPISVPCYADRMNIGKIVTAGRLNHQKNQKMLIEAFEHISVNFPNSKLYIYGEGELRNELEEYVVRCNLQNRVFLPGNVSDIHEQIKDANIFVLSSNFEGLSNMLLEAMMMGLPCISTNCAGADEYIEHNVNGMLIDIGNVAELEEAITCLLLNNDAAVSMAENAKEMSRNFAKDTVLQEWFELIDADEERE